MAYLNFKRMLYKIHEIGMVILTLLQQSCQLKCGLTLTQIENSASKE